MRKQHFCKRCGAKISRSTLTEQCRSCASMRPQKKATEETKKKISLSKRKNPIRYWLGKKRPSMTGEKNPLWKGGISTYQRKLWLNQQRRILKKGCVGSFSQGEWDTLKAQYNWTCPSCHKPEPEISLTVDHIIPITKGGSNNIENIQPLCRKCNSIKGNRIIIKY